MVARQLINSQLIWGKLMKINYILLTCLLLFFQIGCNSENNKEQIIQEIINKNNYKDFYSTKTIFSILDKETREEYISCYKTALSEFYSQNLTPNELKALSNFYDEPIVQKIRNNFKNNIKSDEKLTSELLSIIDTKYPIVQKISSLDFNEKLNDYISEYFDNHIK